jgi:hypothetical protein
LHADQHPADRICLVCIDLHEGTWYYLLGLVSVS